MIEDEMRAKRALENALKSFLAGVTIPVRPDPFCLTCSTLYALAEEVRRSTPLNVTVDWSGGGIVFKDASASRP